MVAFLSPAAHCALPFGRPGPGERNDEDRVIARPLEQVRDELEQRRIGPLHVLEDEHDRVALREALEEETPPGEQLGLLEVRTRLERQELGDARPDPRAFLGVFDGARRERRRASTHAVSSSSPSAMPARIRTISASAQYVTPSP